MKKRLETVSGALRTWERSELEQASRKVMRGLTVKVELFDDETDEETEHELPGKHAVCGRCEGYGSHLNPAIGEYAFTREEFEETFHDDEDREEYFKRGGIYDVPCEVCAGARVVVVVDKSQLSPEQKAIYGKHRKREQERLQEEAEERRTMRRECGEW